MDVNTSFRSHLKVDSAEKAFLLDASLKKMIKLIDKHPDNDPDLCLAKMKQIAIDYLRELSFKVENEPKIA